MARSRYYRVLTGLNYPGKRGEKRVEPGEIVSDIPSASLEWLLSRGCVEKVKEESAEEEGDES